MKKKKKIKIDIKSLKIRINFHKPTLVHKSKKIYNRQREKQSFRKDIEDIEDK